MDRELLYRFFNGTASEAERMRIREWAEAAPENMRELLNERKLYTAVILAGENSSFESRKKAARHLSRGIACVARYAAVFIAAVALTWFAAGRKEMPAQLVQIKVPLGQYMNLTLADGSTVYLNSGTTFSYPAVFSGKERQVEIDGEGFFHVARTENGCPFTVNTSKGKVQVLGTKFNVEAYAKKDRFVTSLVEGKVQVLTEAGKLVLQPNEKATFSGGTLRKEPLPDRSSYNWTGGIIEFNNIRFSDLMDEFEKIYGVRIVIEDPALGENSCLGKFRRIDGLDYALRVLQVNIPFEYRQDFETQTFYIN